jgi:hypothetical protein
MWAIQIKWFGTLKEYDKINVSTSQHKIMELSVIKNKTQYEAYLKWVDEIFHKELHIPAEVFLLKVSSIILSFI